MSVEQTTQLIQLILNSVLLMVVCVIALGRLGVRQASLEETLKATTRQYATLWQVAREAKGSQQRSSFQHRLVQAKKVLRQQQQHYLLSYYSLLATYYAFLFSIFSIFTLTLRTLIQGDWLIGFALGLFMVSVTGLLAGVGLTLVELHNSKLPFWDEIEEIVGIRKNAGQPVKLPQVQSYRQPGRASRHKPLALRPAPRGARVS